LLIQIIEPVACSTLPPDQKVREAIRAYLQAMLDNRDLAAVLLLEHRSLEPQFNARHIPRRDRFERLWRDMLQEGYDQGIFTFADAALAARYLLGVLNWTITWYRPDGALTPERLSAQFSDLYLGGLLVRGG
jgi:TetR/AcrR family transcriptional regulator, cholesterol catabolism regulator